MKPDDLSSLQDDRIERALEGLLSAAEMEAFKADVIRNPALRAAYAESVWLHGRLRAEGERLPQLLGRETGELEALPHAGVKPGWAYLGAALAAVAAVVALGLVLARGRGEVKSATVATLVQAQNSKWAGSTLPTLEHSKLGRGMLALVEGVATLRFDSGASVTLEAPTRLEIVDAMNCRLLEGSVTAEVPVSAHGFAVETPDLKVVDLGTRFGVTAGASGDSHVYVFEGEVELDKLSGKEMRRLKQGKTFHVNSGATAVTALEPKRFQLEQAPDGWTSIPTSFGRGQDTFVRRGTTNVAGAQPLLMIKHTELELSRKNERRVILTFDLSKINPASVSEAQLVLNPEPSGLGFSAMVPDAKFAVYGVTDESLDLWNENSARWDDAPAMNDDGLVASRTRKLAEFWIPRGGVGATLTVRGDELATFLRSDTNGLATFIIVRETGETDPSGLVHAFASKEHPSARPPTLRVR
jgi:hypothetical protein